MPDERNLFDDDSLLPDWMREPGGSDEVPPEDDAGGEEIPWDQPADSRPMPSRSEPAAPAPWEMLPGDAPRAFSPPRTPAPWDQLPLDREDANAGVTPGEESWLEDDQRGEMTGDEIPRGFTSMLPWRETDAEPEPPSPSQQAGLPDEEFTMAGLLAELDQQPPADEPPPQKAPSLADRLRALSPKSEPRKSAEPPPAPRPMTEQEAEWMSAFGQNAGGAPAGAEDDMAWLQGESGRAAPPPPPAASEEQAFDDRFDDEEGLSDDEGDMPWLSEDLGEPAALRKLQTGELTQEPAAPAESLPDWLSGPAQEEEPEAPPQEPAAPADETLPEWLTKPEEPKRKTGIRRIVEPQPPAGMTYEEWEQAEADREREARKTPEERLLEQVPDWFDKIEPGQPDAPQEPPAGPQGPEFVPGWFMGLEDKSPDDAPDWVRQMDFSTDALTAPFGSREAPADQPPGEADLPDWFKGVAAPEVEGVDWDAMFVAPSVPQDPAPADEEFDYLDRGPQELEPAGEQGDLFPRASQEPSPEWLEPPLPPAAGDFDLDQLARQLDADWQDEAPLAPMDFDLPERETPAREPAAAWQDEPSAEEFDLPELEALTGAAEDAWRDEPAAQESPAEEFDLPDLELFGEGMAEEPAPGEVPDWLRPAAPLAGPPQEAGSIAEPQDVPFPELDLDQTMPGDASSRDLAARVRRESLPEEPSAEDFVERFEPAAPALGTEAPDWLREMADEGLALPADDVDLSPAEWDRQPDEPLGEADAGMDWLGELTPDDMPVPEPTDVAPPPRPSLDTLDSDALDRLLGLSGSAVEPRESLWGSEALGLPAEERPDIFEITGVPDAAPQDELPDLDTLFGQEPFADEAPPSEPEEPRRRPAPETAPVFRTEAPPQEPPSAPTEVQPEWVEEMRPSDLPVVVRAGGAEASVKQKQVVELPERLRALRDLTLREVPSAEEAPASDAGALAGITGALPAAEVMLPARQVRPTEGLVITKEQQARLNRLNALLSQVAAEEEQAETEKATFAEAERLALEGLMPEAAPVARRKRRARRFRLDRVLIALLMLAALVAPFATDAVNFADDPPPLAGARLGVPAAVDAVQPGSYVLFAFEYNPTASGELDQLATAVLRDVLARSAVPLVISTNPAGAFHAQAVIERMAADNALLTVRGAGEESLEAGQDYVVLGYLPGEAVGVRSLWQTSVDAAGNFNPLPAFETDLRGDETGLMITSLERDIALIAVVGEDSGAVRTWAEQLQDVAVPKIALVTASTEPLVVPYVESGRYAGYLAGVRDAMRYDAERNAFARAPYVMPDKAPETLPNPEAARWHSLALGTAAAAGLIALGAVLNLLRSLRRRGRR